MAETVLDFKEGSKNSTHNSDVFSGQVSRNKAGEEGDRYKYHLLLKCSFQRGILLVNNTKPLTVVKMKDNSEVPLTPPSRNALHNCHFKYLCASYAQVIQGKK